MKQNKKSFKKEQFNNKNINSGIINIESIFNNNTTNKKKKNIKNKINEIEKDNLINRNKTTEKKKKKHYYTSNNLFENSQKEKKNNLGSNYKTETNNNRVNR